MFPNTGTRFLIAIALSVSALFGQAGNAGYGVNGSGSGSGGTNGSGVLVQEYVLSSAQASVTFSSLPTGYRDLRVVVRGRTDKASTHGDVLLRFNSDTGANYDYESTFLQNTAFGGNPATAATSIYCGSIPAASSPTNEGSTSEITVSNFSGTTFEKSTFCRAGHKDSNSNAGMTSTYSSGFWRNTAAITSITVLPDSGNFITGSIISLYADAPIAGPGGGIGSYSFTSPLSLIGSAVSLSSSGVTPASYTNANVTVDSLGRITAASNGGGGTWGSITGTLSGQTDLQTALNAKQATITVLPVANGGNGTATPALTAGSNVTITGSWPNYTITSSGGSGAAWGAITGTLSSQGDLQTALNAKQATITLLPVANGGTGTATPGIVAGTNVTVSGTWPNQTINASGTGGSGISSGTSLPATCTPGTDTLYLKTNNTPNQQLYSCSAINTWTQNEILGASGALTVDGTTGALDIVTSVVPRLAAVNAFAGRNSFTVSDFTMQAVPASPAAGKLSIYANSDGSMHVINAAGTDSAIGGGGGSSFNQTIQVGGTPVTQRAKLNIVAGTNVTVTPTDNGSDTTTLTIAASGVGGTTVAANGPYLDIAGTHYILPHMITPVLMSTSGFAAAFGTVGVNTSTLAPLLSSTGGQNAYVKTLAGSTTRTAMRCSLDASSSDSGCGLVVLTNTNEGDACFIKTIGSNGTIFRCAHLTAGVEDGTPYSVNAFPYSASDFWIGIDNATTTGTGAPKFLISGDGGRTWQKVVGFNSNLASNPVTGGVYLTGTASAQMLSYDNH